SSRRQHTRFSRDWSSDVCSSDLPEAELGVPAQPFDFAFPKSDLSQPVDFNALTGAIGNQQASRFWIDINHKYWAKLWSWPMGIFVLREPGKQNDPSQGRKVRHATSAPWGLI